MVRLKFPITTFSQCSQSNLALKTRSLMPLMFSIFDSTSPLTEVAANHPIVIWQDAMVGVAAMALLQVVVIGFVGSWIVLGFWMSC
ncbi:hypothetical protein Pyn_23277 [Prunus yedoensis var. nudiflora]|uniref:Uncharacterized protein n=1 Tax=Prunus yedoensis var. nudiflora TaxID=2094558 RepID=A0A314YZX2_PRUYE|nr:hypothetical protein Pyn_23277 [Prunus yedoensis var. nudiflora]